MKIGIKIKTSNVLSIIGGGTVATAIFIIAIVFFSPLGLIQRLPWNSQPLINGTAATYQIKYNVQTSFGLYPVSQLSYTPQVPYYTIAPGLSNVDLQGISLNQDEINQLVKYGFVLVANNNYKNIYDIYQNDLIPKFVTVDLVLHAYHVLYDLSLRILEATQFYYTFETFLDALRMQQLDLNTSSSITSNVVHDALTRNVAYLSVMLYLLNKTAYPIPTAVESMVTAELVNINNSIIATSPIFNYKEDYSQYIVRGHYTRSALLSNYFQAMMYAGRMGFLLQDPPTGPINLKINLTRMALLLLSSFNTTINGESLWTLWDSLYQPITFYVGASDDLTAIQYYQLWQKFNAPKGNQLANDSFITTFINTALQYPSPKINSMLFTAEPNGTGIPAGFRLLGQRFTPDSYIFQQLVAPYVGTIGNYRKLPTGLDIFSVFGSPQAAALLQGQNQTYANYNSQIQKLRQEFGNLTVSDWTQNLYYLWLYTLFPLLQPATAGYPAVMQSNNWSDMALMTALGSWTELRHDTILYTKQSNTVYITIQQILPVLDGYVEPYPELYARLGSLTSLMENGLMERGLLIPGLDTLLNQMTIIMNNLTSISIKELENKQLTSQEFGFINNVGEILGNIASYNSTLAHSIQNIVNGTTDNRMAVVADVHTDLPDNIVLEEATGNPFLIYTVVPDQNGHLRLVEGGTYSYYEFNQSLSNRLSDEQWQSMLDTNPPALPLWVTNFLPIST